MLRTLSALAQLDCLHYYYRRTALRAQRRRTRVLGLRFCFSSLSVPRHRTLFFRLFTANDIHPSICIPSPALCLTQMVCFLFFSMLGNDLIESLIGIGIGTNPVEADPTMQMLSTPTNEGELAFSRDVTSACQTTVPRCSSSTYPSRNLKLEDVP